MQSLGNMSVPPSSAISSACCASTFTQSSPLCGSKNALDTPRSSNRTQTGLMVKPLTVSAGEAVWGIGVLRVDVCRQLPGAELFGLRFALNLFFAWGPVRALAGLSQSRWWPARRRAWPQTDLPAGGSGSGPVQIRPIGYRHHANTERHPSHPNLACPSPAPPRSHGWTARKAPSSCMASATSLFRR
jgi:hypothetical protein